MDEQVNTEQAETKAEQQTEKATDTVSKEQERLDQVLAENKTLREQNELLQQNQAVIAANANAAAANKTAPFDIYKEVGLDPNEPTDIPNQEQLRKINEYHRQQNQKILNQIQFKQDHPDYPQIVGTAEQIQTGQFAEPLKQAIKENPTLMATIQNSADPMKAAYAIGKMQQKKKAEGDKTKTTKKEAQAAIDEAVGNANRVKTSANAKGGDTGLSEEGRVATMPEAEFIKAFNAFGGDL